MADDTLPMATLFKACREVAEAAMAPLHYAELTRLAFARLGFSTDSVNWKRQIEDVREKLLEAGLRGFGYLGAPHCLAYLKEWLPQQTMFNPVLPVRINATLEAGERAIFNALMRKFLDKTQARPETIARSRARGLLVEHHVRCWFEAKWPELVLPPDNEGAWEQPCDHDFKLRLTGRLLRIDVAGPKADGTYGTPRGGGKTTTDIHIIASIVGNDVVIHGFVPGDEYRHIFSSWDTHPISRMAFWLNCNRLDIDYNLFGGQRPGKTERTVIERR
ncbi:MAG: hypothetical protein Q8O40_08540 [Chloroflexota bacterium]|nr:hypothetical protein [Chloroflexota bacterium]